MDTKQLWKRVQDNLDEDDIVLDIRFIDPTNNKISFQSVEEFIELRLIIKKKDLGYTTNLGNLELNFSNYDKNTGTVEIFTGSVINLKNTDKEVDYLFKFIRDLGNYFNTSVGVFVEGWSNTSPSVVYDIRTKNFKIPE